MKHKEHLKTRADHIDKESYFILTLDTGETINENDYSFRDFSTEKLVIYRDTKKVVKLCNLPALSIKMKHHELEYEMKIPTDCQVYQSIRSISEVYDGITNSKIIGRFVGIVKDGVVVQELYLDGQLGQITGFKK